MSEREDTPYQRLKALQNEIRLEQGRKSPIKELIVLASQNDPFYAGTEGQRAMVVRESRLASTEDDLYCPVCGVEGEA